MEHPSREMGVREPSTGKCFNIGTFKIESLEAILRHKIISNLNDNTLLLKICESFVRGTYPILRPWSAASFIQFFFSRL